MFNLDDLQSWCDDLNKWIIELDCTEELILTGGKGEFPLKVDYENDDVEQGLNVLVYLTLWMCLKNNKKAPDHIHSRIVMASISEPWQKIYFAFCDKLDGKNIHEYRTKLTQLQELWQLAS